VLTFSNNQLSSLPEELGGLAKLRELVISLNRYVELYAVLEGFIEFDASGFLHVYSVIPVRERTVD
jgi:hypothetical protein